MGCNCKSRNFPQTDTVSVSTDSYKEDLRSYSIDTIDKLPVHSCGNGCDGIGEVLKFPVYKGIAADYEAACKIANERVAPLGSPCVIRYYIDSPDPSAVSGKTGMILCISNTYGNAPLIIG